MPSFARVEIALLTILFSRPTLPGRTSDFLGQGTPVRFFACDSFTARRRDCSGAPLADRTRRSVAAGTFQRDPVHPRLVADGEL